MRTTGLAFTAFQIASVVVVLATLATLSRRRPARVVLVEYGALAIAGFLGEETCIALYEHYAYAPGWHARVHLVPLLVPLIWPLVILSARDVVRGLLPRLGVVAQACAVGVAVAFDAALIEVLSVRAGFWRWAEPGILGVPVIGILGWGYFAFGASLALDRPAGPVARVALVLALAPLAAHTAIVSSWWALFRWAGRGAWGTGGVVAHAALAAALCVCVLVARRRGAGIGPDVWRPRLAATALFVAVFAATAARSPEHWVVFAASAAPYVVALRRA